MTVVANYNNVLTKPMRAEDVRIYTKGATEVILERCSNILTSDGQIEMLSLEKKGDIKQNVISAYAKQAYRTFALAYKDVSREEFESKDLENEEDAEFAETNLTLIGIVGI